ncbi:hypothetical protein [Paraburkholderia sp.]|uniref:hypothetical protein n=1 Tax=Paraburkholderia sp. TaxID=1926495 RepID=UPI002AFFDDA9|nr:hypothetical protein [Paraburkholderia sp.]
MSAEERAVTFRVIAIGVMPGGANASAGLAWRKCSSAVRVEFQRGFQVAHARDVEEGNTMRLLSSF